MVQQEGRRNREVLERMMEIITNGELDALPEVLHPDFVQVMPQSGERVVGIENFRRILESMPGRTGASGLKIARDPHIAGDEEHYVMTPTFNVVKVEGTGDELTSYVKGRYPDGSDWYIVTLSSFRDGKIVKRVDFFAPFYDAPEWRSAWVEKD
jgi:ketosteroid isomerase-like protein